MALRKDTIALEIIVNGEKGTKTYRDLINSSRQLKREILELTPGTEEFIRKSRQLQNVNTKLKEIRDILCKHKVPTQTLLCQKWGVCIMPS